MLGVLLVAVAVAKSPCKELKPKHKPDADTIGAVSGMLQTALASAGAAVPAQVLAVGSAALPQGGSTGMRFGDDERAWLLYQVCTMKEAGLLSQEKAEEIVATILVGNTTQDGAPVPFGAPPGMTPEQTAGRLSVVHAMENACKIRGPGSKEICEMHRQMLEQYDAQIRAANGQ